MEIDYRTYEERQQSAGDGTADDAADENKLIELNERKMFDQVIKRYDMKYLTSQQGSFFSRGSNVDENGINHKELAKSVAGKRYAPPYEVRQVLRKDDLLSKTFLDQYMVEQMVSDH